MTTTLIAQPSRGGYRSKADVLVALGSGFIGSMLVAAAVLKIRDPSETLRTLGYTYRVILGEDYSNLVPFITLSMLVFIEIVLGINLVAQVAVRKLLLMAAVLFAGFSGFMLWLVVQEAPVGCGCGFGEEVASMNDVVRGCVLFTVCCGVVVVWDRTRENRLVGPSN